MTLCATTWTTTTRTHLRLGCRVRFRVWELNRRPQKTAGYDTGVPKDGDQRRIIAEWCSTELIAAEIGRVASPQHHHNLKSQPLSGWDFFCPERQCWRGSGPLPCARQPHDRASSCTFSASLLAVFSVCLASAFDPVSSIHAGLRGAGCEWQLLYRRRPRTKKAKKTARRRRLARECRFTPGARAPLSGLSTQWATGSASIVPAPFPTYRPTARRPPGPARSGASGGAPVSR